MREETYDTDLCVVGGGLSGMIAAISAARHGAKVVLLQDRPVLGGNCSSEVRMHVCGAHGENRRETGIIEELLLDNFYYNRTPSFSVWDAVLYGKVQYQKNITLLLNASVFDVEMDGNTVVAVKAWQGTSESRIRVSAKLFADCSGDGILAPLTGAEYHFGREARSEFNESIAPIEADRKTMGMSCLLQAREYTSPQEFIPFPWAYSFTEGKEALLAGHCVDFTRTNLWWMEVGGEMNSIDDTEKCREELLRIAFGVWDYIKNHSPDRDRFRNYALDWQGFLPGKRESRRYCGDHMLTQNDVSAEGRFEDIVAYGGWSMDDHFPDGFYHNGHSTTYHPAPSPYGIPYRSLYSRNIANLFCAGRCHSATHSAMSSTRVMATTSLMGQAVGTAAAIASANGLSPRGVYEHKLAELQKQLMDDDCWLPWKTRPVSRLCLDSAISSSGGDGAELLRNGTDRPWDGCRNSWQGGTGCSIEYRFPEECEIKSARMVFDSNLNRKDSSRLNSQSRLLNMRYYTKLSDGGFMPPETLVRGFRIETLDSSGQWNTVCEEHNNFQRLVKAPVDARCLGVRLTPLSTWGTETVNIFAFEVC